MDGLALVGSIKREMAGLAPQIDGARKEVSQLLAELGRISQEMAIVKARTPQAQLDAMRADIERAAKLLEDATASLGTRLRELMAKATENANKIDALHQAHGSEVRRLDARLDEAMKTFVRLQTGTDSGEIDALRTELATERKRIDALLSSIANAR